jgi:hypothetical protein
MQKNNKFKVHDVGSACNTHGREDEYMNGLGGKSRRIDTLGRPRVEDNAEKNLRGIK